MVVTLNVNNSSICLWAGISKDMAVAEQSVVRDKGMYCRGKHCSEAIRISAVMEANLI